MTTVIWTYCCNDETCPGGGDEFEKVTRPPKCKYCHADMQLRDRRVAILMRGEE